MAKYAPDVDHNENIAIARAQMASFSLGRLRKMRHVTQHEMAEKMHVKQPTISEMERSPQMSVAYIQRYAEALGLHMSINFYDEKGRVMEIWG